jgi:Bacterial EndoU nuclease
LPDQKELEGHIISKNLKKAMLTEGAKIVKRVPHPSLSGVEKIEYQIPALDVAGKPTGLMKSKVFEKTVYDPKVVSDTQILEWGKQAAYDAAKRGQLSREWTGTASNGARFRGYLDDVGDVRSFFPDF